MLESGHRGLALVRAMLAACALGVAACGPAAPGGLGGGDHEVLGYGISISRPVMGTLAKVSVFMHSDEQTAADQACGAALDEVARIEALVNMWSPDSALQRWNAAVRTDGRAPMPRELALLLDVALRIGVETGGAFDPTVGFALDELGFYGDKPRVVLEAGVPEAARARWAAHVGRERVRIEWPEGSPLDATAPGLPALVTVERELQRAAGSAETVWVAGDGVVVDLSALAKGYAAWRALGVLAEAGFRNARVDLGGSSIAAQGVEVEPLQGWQVELPEAGGVRALRLIDASLSTSGQTSLTVDGSATGASHQFDPRELAPVAHKTEMVAVHAREAWLGDALSTALLVMGADAGATWCAAHPEWVRGVAFYVAGASGPEIGFHGVW